MKTSTVEILCDSCHKPIRLGSPDAIFLTLRGPKIGHKKADLCNMECLEMWVRIESIIVR